MTQPRSPFSVLILTYNRETGTVEASAHNTTKLEALQMLQRYSLALIDGLTEGPATDNSPAEPEVLDEQGALPNGN